MKRRRSYSRHGLHALMARVKVRGLHAIDRRTAAGRALVVWRSEMLADLGGEAAVSAQQRALVDLATRTRLYVDSLDAWLVEQPSLVLKRRKAVLPVLRERQQLADSLARLLGQLGLQRRARPVPSLREYLDARASATSRHEAPQAQPAPTEPTIADAHAPSVLGEATRPAEGAPAAADRSAARREVAGVPEDAGASPASPAEWT